MLVFKQTKKKRVDPPQRDVFDPVLKQSKERPQDLQTQLSSQADPTSKRRVSSGFAGSRPGSPGRPGYGSTRRVDWVLPGCCTGRSFNKPEPVQPPGRPGSGSTHRAGPGLITVLMSHQRTNELLK
jgi:hypothetical protein